MNQAPMTIPAGSRLTHPPRPAVPSWDEPVVLLRDASGHVLATVEMLGAPSSRNLPE